MDGYYKNINNLCTRCPKKFSVCMNDTNGTCVNNINRKNFLYSCVCEDGYFDNSDFNDKMC